MPERITWMRDLLLWELADPATLVMASDSLGGIGALPQDRYSCPPKDVGYFTARVVLFELLAAGAVPRLLLFTLANGGEYARQILAGVRLALAEAGLPEDFPVNGSSEKNMATEMTSAGFTLIGTRSERYRPGSAQPGDGLWLVGRPKSAPADPVVRGDPEFCSFAQLADLDRESGVHDMVPVGSGGALPEIERMAEQSRTRAVIDPSFAGLLDRSGGPATALVVAASEQAVEVLGRLGVSASPPSVPVTRVGILEPLEFPP